MSGGYYAQYPPPPPAHQHAYAAPQYAPPQPPHQPPPTFSLRIDQGPERAKLVSRDKIKDRKPIDPPPIIRCNHSDTQSAYNPYLFCCATLYDEERDEPKQSNGSLPALVGTTVSSSHRLKGVNNDEGTFFVFGDLAPCCAGPARLHFVLYELKNGEARALADVTSNVFEISNAKDWDGVKESTFLSRAFSDQGVKLRLKKESRNGRRGMPTNQFQIPSASQAQLLPHIQPQIQSQPSYTPHPQHSYQPQHPPQSTASWDEDEEIEGRAGKRQRVTYSGASYPGYSAPQTPMPGSYTAYPSQDQAAPYAYNLPYQTRPAHHGHQGSPYSQSPAQQYSPQQFAQYRRETYYPNPPQQTAHYPNYGMPTSTAYQTQTYAPVDNPQQSFGSQGQPSCAQSQTPLTLPPMRQAPPANPDYPPPPG